MSGANRLPDPETVFASSDTVAEIVVEPYGELTTTDEIRAVFGLSEAELPDEMLTQRIYAGEVATALHSLDPTLPDTYTDRLQDKEYLLQNFALYCIAARICDVLPLIAARSMTDSKAMFQRFDTDLQDVIKAIRDRYALASKALQTALESVKPRETVVRLKGGRPKSDRVTGGTS